MRSNQILTILAVAAGSLMAVNASAGQFGASIYGAFNTHSMEDVNNDIEATNQGLGTDYNKIENGFTGGLDLRMWANPNVMIMAGWEPLFSTAKDETDAAPDIKLTTHALSLSGAYFFPAQGTARYGIGAGLGYYMAGGEIDGAPGNFSGGGVGFHFMGMSEWTVSPGFAVTAAAGYRIAKISNMEFDSAETTDLDYTGFTSRLGLSFYMPQAN
jgi:outer membrane protein W